MPVALAETSGAGTMTMASLLSIITEVFTAGMLEAVATFLASEPIVYLFGLVCLILAVKVVKDILH